MADVAVGEEGVEDRGAGDEGGPGDVHVARVADPHLHVPERCHDGRREDEPDEQEPPDPADHVELAPAPVADGAARGALVDAALDQLLAHLALLGHAQEEPGERDDRDERALEHHQRAGEALVGVGRQPEVVVPGLVDVVEGGAAPDEDVAEDRRDEPDADDVARASRRCRTTPGAGSVSRIGSQRTIPR